MCGRFYLDVDFDDILDRYGYLIFDDDYVPRKEIFPTQPIAVITPKAQEYHLAYMDWGFTPSFSKRPVINARSESVFEKRLFQKDVLEHRCLVPATGYFEWLHESGRKVKHRVHLEQQGIFSMAGIYQILKNEEGHPFYQVSILTRQAAPDIAWLHDRMPLILPRAKEMEYLQPGLDQPDIERIFEHAVLNQIHVESEGEKQLSLFDL